jgi:hypothetical protein
MDEFRHFGSIIIVTTDAILARCMTSSQPPGENRVACQPVGKIIGSAEKIGLVGKPEPQVFLGLICEISHTQTNLNSELSW